MKKTLFVIMSLVITAYFGWKQVNANPIESVGVGGETLKEYFEEHCNDASHTDFSEVVTNDNGSTSGEYDALIAEFNRNGVPEFYGGCYVENNSLVLCVTDEKAAAEWDFIKENNCTLKSVRYALSELQTAYAGLMSRVAKDGKAVYYGFSFGCVDEKNNCVRVGVSTDKEDLVKFDAYFDSDIFVCENAGRAQLMSTTYVRGGYKL